MAYWDLFEEMDSLRRDIDRAFRGYGSGGLFGNFLPGIGFGGEPRMNLAEDDKNFYVEALVPGIDPKDLDLNVMQNTLTLSGERKESETKGRTWHRRERGAGKFMRTIELPASVNTEKVSADYRNGVLMITLPKAEQAQVKRITVQAH